MKVQPCSINGIEFDALINESRTYNSNVPEYAVEDGYNVSDHISVRPMTLEITGYITNTPVTWIGHGTGRVEAVVNQLENLYFSRRLVTVSTSTDVYTDMAITSLTVPKDETNKTSREIKIGLKHVTVVSARRTSIPDDYVRGGMTGINVGTSGTGSGGRVSSGASGRPEAADQKSEKKASALYNLVY